MADHNAECDPVFGDYVALLKPRDMSVVVFTAGKEDVEVVDVDVEMEEEESTGEIQSSG